MIPKGESWVNRTTLVEALGLLKEDAAFVRGFKRGVGLVLLSWLLAYVGGCITYPLIKTLF